jgi:hypothetical protein
VKAVSDIRLDGDLGGAAALAARRRGAGGLPSSKRQGVVRLEVHVHKSDTPLVRGIVKAIADPEREAEARALSRERFGEAVGLKAMLAAAPLADIDLTRERTTGRDVEP